MLMSYAMMKYDVLMRNLDAVCTENTTQWQESLMSSPLNHASVLAHLLHPEQTFLFGGQATPLLLHQE